MKKVSIFLALAFCFLGKQSFADEETLDSLKSKLEKVFQIPNQEEQALNLVKQWLKLEGNPNEIIFGDNQSLLWISVARSYIKVSHLP